VDGAVGIRDGGILSTPYEVSRSPELKGEKASFQITLATR